MKPVLLLVFNRPDTTERVFERIRQYRPQKLYVAGDGPRTDRDESALVEAARAIAIDVDWPCQLQTRFRASNLGCKAAVSDAISWFFSCEPMGIILEDDCLPAPDFFRFCGQLLDHHADDSQVAVITGNNFQQGHRRGDASYYFSRYNHCWGWASWRRAWEMYQGDIDFWPAWKKSEDWCQRFDDPAERRYWERVFERVYRGRIDSWAYPWMASVWFQRGLTATPNENLVSNIGFDARATHTRQVDSPVAALPTRGIDAIRHPPAVHRHAIADRYTFDFAFGGRDHRFPRRYLRLPGVAWRYLLRKINTR